jgi:ubiquinone/menaquinone biosynthesis C-methylase UbiE
VSISPIHDSRRSDLFADAGIAHDFPAADIGALPLAHGTFDAVYYAYVINRIADTVVQETGMAELLRVVRSGGVVVVIAANPRRYEMPARKPARPQGAGSRQTAPGNHAINAMG